jgi:beta-glucanase (GH16 family)
MMVRRTTLVVALAATVALFLVSSTALTSADPGWHTTFEDEFAGSAGAQPNPAVWIPDVGGQGFGNNELQYYTAGKNTFLDGDGHLVIEARAGSDGHTCWYGPCRYTSGKVTTKDWGKPATFSQQYGKFEARIKVPVGAGMFPAFWLLGDDVDKVGHPNSGEIDVMEALGHEPALVQQHAHGPGMNYGDAFSLPDGQSVADWHTYTVVWSPYNIEWQVDGQTTRTLTKAEAGDGWVFDHPFYILLNLAVGGSWPGDPDPATVFPGRMLVDYVRVSQPDAP